MEGSTYYHLFVLRAYLLTLRGTDPAALPADAADRLAGMVQVLAGLAAPDGTLPMLHDGPFDRVPAHLEVLEVCVLAGQLWARIVAVIVAMLSAIAAPNEAAIAHCWPSVSGRCRLCARR